MGHFAAKYMLQTHSGFIVSPLDTTHCSIMLSIFLAYLYDFYANELPNLKQVFVPGHTHEESHRITDIPKYEFQGESGVVDVDITICGQYAPSRTHRCFSQAELLTSPTRSKGRQSNLQ